MSELSLRGKNLTQLEADILADNLHVSKLDLTENSFKYVMMFLFYCVYFIYFSFIFISHPILTPPPHPTTSHPKPPTLQRFPILKKIHKFKNPCSRQQQHQNPQIIPTITNSGYIMVKQ